MRSSVPASSGLRRIAMLHLHAEVQLLHEVLLGREVVVRVAERDPGLVGDASQRGLVVPALAEGCERGVADEGPGARALAVGLPAFSNMFKIYASPCPFVERLRTLAE